MAAELFIYVSQKVQKKALTSGCFLFIFRNCLFISDEFPGLYLSLQNPFIIKSNSGRCRILFPLILHIHSQFPMPFHFPQQFLTYYAPMNKKSQQTILFSAPPRHGRLLFFNLAEARKTSFFQPRRPDACRFTFRFFSLILEIYRSFPLIQVISV